jgi:hypothetical protein
MQLLVGNAPCAGPTSPFDDARANIRYLTAVGFA